MKVDAERNLLFVRGRRSRRPKNGIVTVASREERAVMFEAPHYSSAGARRDAAFALPAESSTAR